jgi:DNA-binding NarL/FixJ family response regulator
MSEIAGVRLTPREKEVAGMVLQGMSYGKMARALGISARTAEKHVANLAEKIARHSPLPAMKRVLAWAVGNLGELGLSPA